MKYQDVEAGSRVRMRTGPRRRPVTATVLERIHSGDGSTALGWTVRVDENRSMDVLARHNFMELLPGMGPTETDRPRDEGKRGKSAHSHAAHTEKAEKRE